MAARAKRDYYEILGVPRTADEQEIKSAFLKLAAEYHAKDKPANIEAVEHFREIVRAYRVLMDLEQRHRYDRFGEAGIIDHPAATGIDTDEIEKWAVPNLSNPLPVNDWPVDFIEYVKNRK